MKSNTSACEEPLNLYLVRHGETEANRLGWVQGSKDVPLNQTGLRQAQALAKRFQHVPFHSVYSSPLSRAFKTALSVAGEHDLAPLTVRALAELNHGLWEGLPDAVIKERYPNELDCWLNNPEAAVMPEGESLAAVWRRAVNGIEKIKKEAGERPRTILVVSHEVLNKVLLCYFLGWDLSRFWCLRQDNTAVNLISFYPDHTQVRLVNDTCHLKTLA